MKHRCATILILAAWCPGACSPPPDAAGGRSAIRPYLGQQPPRDSAVVFAPGVVSVEGRYELAVSFSPDGREMLVTGVVPRRPAVLLYFAASDSGWVGPEEVHLANGQRREEMEAFFTPDGGRIYFAAYDRGPDLRIWAVDRDEGGWRSPRQMGAPLGDHAAMYPTTTAAGVIYYSNVSEERIFRATVQGDSVTDIEDTGIEAMHAFPAPDESFLLLDVMNPDDNDADLFVAFRQEDGSWSPPVDLGPGVNTQFGETCPSLSADGRYIFFSRYNEPNEIADVYWVSAAVIETARRGAAAGG